MPGGQQPREAAEDAGTQDARDEGHHADQARWPYGVLRWGGRARAREPEQPIHEDASERDPDYRLDDPENFSNQDGADRMLEMKCEKRCNEHSMVVDPAEHRVKHENSGQNGERE